LDCSGNTVVNLQFEHFFNAGYGGAAEVSVSGDNGSTWTVLGTWSASSTINAQLEQYDISSVAAGHSQVLVKFNWTGDYSWYWAVDDVLIFEPVDNDLGVTAVSPSGLVMSGSSVTPTVTIKNFGGVSQATYDITLVSTPAGYNQTVTNPGTIDPGATLTVIFPEWSPADGNYTLTATVNLSGDANASNNVATSDIEVRDPVFGDVISTFTTEAAGCPGIETDGTNIYTAYWNSANFDKYDMVGNYIETFTVTGVSQVRPKSSTDLFS